MFITDIIFNTYNVVGNKITITFADNNHITIT